MRNVLQQLCGSWVGAGWGPDATQWVDAGADHVAEAAPLSAALQVRMLCVVNQSRTKANESNMYPRQEQIADTATSAQPAKPAHSTPSEMTEEAL